MLFTSHWLNVTLVQLDLDNSSIYAKLRRLLSGKRWGFFLVGWLVNGTRFLKVLLGIVMKAF